MSRSLLLAIVPVVLALAHAARADVAPSPFEGNRFIERYIAIDREQVPADIELRYSTVHRKGRAVNVDLSKPIGPNTLELSVQSGNCSMGAPPGSCLSDGIELPPHQEVAIAVDRRVRVVRHVQLRLVSTPRGKNLLATGLEDVFHDGAGAVVCRRPPLADNDIEYDPCDPTTATRKLVHYAKIVAAVGAPVLLLGAILLIRSRRRKTRTTARGAGLGETALRRRVH